MNDTKVMKKSFSRLAVGMLFLCNPLFSFVDILPDFIGCFFLFSAFRPLLFLDVRMQTARSSARLFALLSVARLFLTPVFLFSTNSDGGNTALLLSFAFATVSLLLEFSIVKNVFESYNYLSVRCDSQKALRYLDPAKSILLIFVVFKNAASTLPDFLTLFSPDSTLEFNHGAEQAAASFLFAKWTAYVVLFVAILIFAVVVFVRLLRYVKAVRAEEDYLVRICEAAAVKEEGEQKLKLRFDFTGALATLTVLALFSIDYYFGYFSILPAPMVFLLCGAVLYRVKPWRRPRSWEYLACAVGLAATVAAYVYRAFFTQDTFVGGASWDNFFAAPPLTVFFGFLQSVCLFVAFLLAANAVTAAAKTAAEIDIAPAKNAAVFFSLVNAALGAYHYFLPKGMSITDLSRTASLFAVIAGCVFLVFTWRMDSAFKKESEWKFY